MLVIYFLEIILPVLDTCDKSDKHKFFIEIEQNTYQIFPTLDINMSPTLRELMNVDKLR